MGQRKGDWTMGRSPSFSDFEPVSSLLSEQGWHCACIKEHSWYYTHQTQKPRQKQVTALCHCLDQGAPGSLQGSVPAFHHAYARLPTQLSSPAPLQTPPHSQPSCRRPPTPEKLHENPVSPVSMDTQWSQTTGHHQSFKRSAHVSHHLGSCSPFLLTINSFQAPTRIQVATSKLIKSNQQ